MLTRHAGRFVPEVSFGRPPVLTLEFTRRLFPGADNFVDRNMLAVNATVLAGRFRGFVETSLRTDELLRFRDLLDKSYRKLRTEWHHEFLGSGLEFRVEGDGLRHFTMVCDLDDQGGIGNQLTFDIAFDQTEIPEMLAALDEVISVFPTIREAGDS